MNKSDLVEQLASDTDMTKKQAEQVVNLVFDSMTETLVQGDRIEIRGFGSFISRHYPAYDGCNPRTGEVIHVAEKHLPFFKVGKDLRERVNGAPAMGEKKDHKRALARRGK